MPAGQSVEGRLWDVLTVLRVCIQQAPRGASQINFAVAVWDGTRHHDVHALTVEGYSVEVVDDDRTPDRRRGGCPVRHAGTGRHGPDAGGAPRDRARNGQLRHGQGRPRVHHQRGPRPAQGHHPPAAGRPRTAARSRRGRLHDDLRGRGAALRHCAASSSCTRFSTTATTRCWPRSRRACPMTGPA